MSLIEEITVENLDHLGIVAGLIDEIGIVELINQKLGVDNREKIAPGQVIKALILNWLGMVSRPLYLFSQFFEDKAIEKLNRTGINSEYLNDDKTGILMDDIYKLGLTNLFIDRTYAGTLYVAYCRYEILHTIISFFLDRYYF
jgi:transposase